MIDYGLYLRKHVIGDEDQSWTYRYMYESSTSTKLLIIEAMYADMVKKRVFGIGNLLADNKQLP